MTSPSDVPRLRIAVVGGTGVVGRPTVTAARAAGHDVLALSRSSGVDVTTGAGLDAALEGVDVVIDVSNVKATGAKASVRFFEAATRTLLDAEQRAGVEHHVALSIVGAAAAPAAYYAGKAAQERVLQARPGGWTVLRATQFHEFAHQVLDAARLGSWHLVPTMLAQPIAAAEVGAALVRAAERGPRGVLPDLAGPREERIADLARRYLAATGSRDHVVELPLPGPWGRSMRDGTLLPGPDAVLGVQTFDQWLAALHR